MVHRENQRRLLKRASSRQTPSFRERPSLPRIGIAFWVLWLLTQNGPALASPPLPLQKKGWSEVSDQRLFKTVGDLQAFGNRATWQKQNQTADYLFQRLKEINGLQVTFHHFQEGGKPWKNVVARLPGKKNAGTVFLFCAHYDSHPAGLKTGSLAPGADDNGTGVAVLLEGARVLAANPGDNTIEWVFFANEEQGHKGSKAYVQALKDKGLSLKGAINIDTIGYTQSSLKDLWRESEGKSWVRKVGHLTKQLLKKPIYFFQTGFKNPNEMLVVGGRPANAPLVEKIVAGLKGSDFGIKKDIGPQCG